MNNGYEIAAYVFLYDCCVYLVHIAFSICRILVENPDKTMVMEYEAAQGVVCWNKAMLCGSVWTVAK